MRRAKAGSTDADATGRRGSKGATLADVASAAGVSTSTASFVLSGRTDMRIAAATAERVVQIADKLNYRPNRSAQALRTGKTATIGFISDAIATTAFGGAAVRGALDVAQARGQMLFVAETLGDPQLEVELLDNLLDRQVDGFIFASMTTREVTLDERLHRIPTVLLNAITAEPITQVVPDEAPGATAAAELLLSAGHQNILIVGDTMPGPQRPYVADLRLQAVRAACQNAGASCEVLILDDYSYGPPSAFRAMTKYLTDHPVPDALYCTNDRFALGAVQALGPSIVPGRDISIIGTDNSDLAAWMRPRLTSVDLPYYDMGRVAAEHLLDGKLNAGRVLLPMTISDGESVCSRGDEA